MPMYTYRREDGTTFDIKQKFSDDPLETCPTTGQSVQRVIHASSIIFKGSGFYVTDNNAKGKVNGAGSSNGNGASGAASNGSSGEASNGNGTSNGNGATASTEKKSETKSDKKVSDPA